jgi:hypothetical protein
MPVWQVLMYSGSKYLGRACELAFETKEAAQWWIDNEADQSPNWRYVPLMLSVYSLEQCKDIWPIKEK